MLRSIVRRVVGGFARLLGGLLALALLASALLILYTTSADFRSRLLERLVPELDSRMAGELTVEGLEGSPLRALRFRNVALAWHGEPIARIASVSVALDWTALLAGHYRVARIEIEEPILVLREHATLGFDWREALAPLIPAPTDPPPPRDEPLPVVIETISLSHGSLQVAPRDRTPILLEGIDLRGRLDFLAERFTLEQARVAMGDSELTGTGDIPFEGRYVYDVAIMSLHPNDLARLDPVLAETLSFLSPASGELVLSGQKDEIEAKGQLLWPETTLDFEVHGAVSELSLPRSTITARLEAGDLLRFLPALGIAGQLTGQLELVRGEGTFDTELRPTPNGKLAANGTLSLVEIPEAQLRLTADRFDLARAWPGHPEWAGSLSGTGTLEARGRERDALTVSVSLALAPSRIGDLELRKGALRAKLERDVIELAELDLESPIGRARAHGRFSTQNDAPVSLKLRLDVDDLGPLLALARGLPDEGGTGSLHAKVDLDGKLERASVAADFALAKFRLGDLRAERARLVFAARGGLTGEQRDAVDAVIETLRLEAALGVWKLEKASGLQVSRDALAWKSARFSNGAATILLDGRLARAGAQDFRLEARALPIAEWARAFPERVSPELLAGGVLDLDLTIGGTAAAPTLDARLVPHALVISDQSIEKAEAALQFASKRGHATLSASTSPALRLDAEAAIPFELAWQDGFVAAPRGDLDAHADCEANDLSFLESFVTEQVEDLGGRARCRLTLVGPLDALRPSGEITAHDLTARPRRTGTRVIDGELEVELAADRFSVRRATATVAGHEATARFRAEGEGPLPTFVTNLTDLTRRGRASNPTPDSAPSPSPSGDYTTKIELVRWPLADTKRDRLIASGVLEASGRFEAPRVVGKVKIDEGTLRPDLAFLAGGPPPKDPTIVFEEDEAPASDASIAGREKGGGTGGGQREGAGDANGSGEQRVNPLSTFAALELEVDIDVGRDLLVKHEHAEVLLAGRVEARKRRDKPLSLVGRIEAQRGFADLQSRRFRLIEGSLELVGGAKIDPVLDVLGRHRAREYVIDARLTGTASKPVLTLSSDPELSQEDILAVLLFGRPADELSQDQQVSFGQRAEQMASAVGMTAVGRTVASAIGLEDLGLQIEELSSDRARVGAYVGRNIFVALGQEFSGEQVQELAIEYEFWPGWSVVGSTTSEGTNAADLVWKIRY